MHATRPPRPRLLAGTPARGASFASPAGLAAAMALAAFLATALVCLWPLELPGDPRQMYVPRMEWVEATGELVVQQMDRRQQENTVWLVARDTLARTELLRERETAAWLDVVDDWRWLPGGELFWISERDGWRHAWSVSRAGEWRCLTPGAFDLQGIVGYDERHLYYHASPDDSVRKYLWRVPLAGGAAERLTPEGQLGSHTYDLAPGGKFALHTRSTFDTPPVIELVSLPEHRTVRVLEASPDRVDVDPRRRCAGLFDRPFAPGLFRVRVWPRNGRAQRVGENPRPL